MTDSVLGKYLFELSPPTLALLLAFVIIGALSVAIIQVFLSLVGENSRSRSDRLTSSGNTDYSSSSHMTSAQSMRAIRASELAACDGSNGAPLYVAVRDPRSVEVTVFDMASGAGFYGPGAPYHVFAGRDATRALARSSVDPKALEGDGLEGLTAHERDTHTQWYDKFTGKYPRVGFLVPDGAVHEDAYRSNSSDQNSTPIEEKKDA